MSFSSKAYLAHEERRLESESVIIKVTRRRYHEVIKQRVLVNPSPDNRTEAEIIEQEDAWLAAHGVPVKPMQ